MRPAEELERLGASFDELEALRARDAGTASRRAEAVSGWSIEQHLYHVALSGELALANVAALVRGGASRIVHQGEPNETARRLFEQQGYERGRTEAPRAVQPPERVEAALLDDELARVRSAIEALRGAKDAVASAPGRIPHRQLGELSASEWLSFARLHTAHHLAIARDVAAALAVRGGAG